MAASPTRVGAFKGAAARRSGAARRSAATGPDPEAARLDRPSCCGPGWSCARRRRRRKGWPWYSPTTSPPQTRNSRVANGWGSTTPASTALIRAWLQEAGPQPSEQAPCPRDRGDALIQLRWRSAAMDPESKPPPCLDHLALATYQAWYAPAARGRAVLEAGGHPSTMLAGAHGRRTRFAIPRLRYGAVMVLIQPSALDRDTDPLATHSPTCHPPHGYAGPLSPWMRQWPPATVVHVASTAPWNGCRARASTLHSTAFRNGRWGDAPSLPFTRQRSR